MKNIIGFIALFAFSAFASAASIPNQLSVQGLVNDNNSGQLLVGAQTVRFTLYDENGGVTKFSQGDDLFSDPTGLGASVLWTEVREVNFVDGIYTSLLGDDENNPLPADAFDSDNVSIGIQIGTDSELSPRLLLASVPYAFRASSAENATGDITPSSVTVVDENGVATPVIDSQGNWLGEAIEGAQGPQGETGLQGPAGEQGPQGIQGIQGIAGAQGPAGATGATGPAGQNGIQIAGDIEPTSIGITDVNGNVIPIVDANGNWIGNATGLQGAQGDKGDQGIQGVAGPAGAKGDQGIQGVAGPAGAKGDQGIQGVAGPAGAKGDKGDQGIQGLAGAAGMPGAPGAKGDQGEPGATGIQGPAGAAASLPTATATGQVITWNGTNYIAQAPASGGSSTPYTSVNFIIALQGVFPSRSSEPFLAEIRMFAGNFAPRGWAFCDGQLIPINSNSALFSILGTTYGGDGRTTFALPDLRGRVAVAPDTVSNIRLGQRNTF